VGAVTMAADQVYCAENVEDNNLSEMGGGYPFCGRHDTAVNFEFAGEASPP